MGVTDPYFVTTAGQNNWRDACEREVLARFSWNEKWGWMPKVIAEPIEKLKKLKEKQVARVQEKKTYAKKATERDPRPLPSSVNHEYGWLAYKPEYQLERYGPFPLSLKVNVDPTFEEIDGEIKKNDLERAQKREANRGKGANCQDSPTALEQNHQNLSASATASRGKTEGNNEKTAKNGKSAPASLKNETQKKILCCCNHKCCALKKKKINS